MTSVKLALGWAITVLLARCAIGQYQYVSGNANSNGQSDNGNLTLGNQATASAPLANPIQASAVSQNFATGGHASISGSASANTNSQSQYCCSGGQSASNGNGGASSNGQALTGTLQNLDQSNSGPSSWNGQSQFNATGTGVTASSNANAYASSYSDTYTQSTYYYSPTYYPTTTTIPYYDITTSASPTKNSAVLNKNVNVGQNQKRGRKSQVNLAQNQLSLRSRGLHAPSKLRSK